MTDRPPPSRRAAARAILAATGLIALALYGSAELWLHAGALGGPAVFGARVARLGPPALALAVVIPLAIAFHEALFMLALRRGLNASDAAGTSAGTLALQRVTALGTLLFVGLHLGYLWWPIVSGDLAPFDAYHVSARRLSTTHAGVPLWGLAEIFGWAAMTHHLIYGAFRRFLGSGSPETLARRRRSGPLFAVVALALFAGGFIPVVHLATGDRLVARASEVPPAT